MSDPAPKIYINTPIDERGAERIEREEKTWTSVKLTVLCIVFLGACLVTLYLMAMTTTETSWSDWLIP